MSALQLLPSCVLSSCVLSVPGRFMGRPGPHQYNAPEVAQQGHTQRHMQSASAPRDPPPNPTHPTFTAQDSTDLQLRPLDF